ncbi:mannose-1-phosphate guanylyltransferase/mannose-6-phosphate isomerase [Vibrio ostreicida]|uniref:mannose-1-phosphate guanylyltransferase n=1 Tax=Vibrio ostreicida TaxID=526588 RepID=A0ABT8BNY1_9VIBR|nr:mannose-1-phosphate guanylyltransferase/mannose-6-phosphate isomerase [Vibrio ostreicida]MDN3608472.1 mannose-1-phosphate guanylyltransferase/mannose-6-phosphate isomerase [Vibrio ostreicida]NPD10294.1 mannose-1-phosphate guanylyltransferase/mannose-6-phosphate isomerase [Vibrio ostreicida]
MIHPIIMAGGTGSRLWPLSRELFPKQFLTLGSDLSMLQETFARLSGIEHSPPTLICNEDHRFIAAEQLRVSGTPYSGIILEPVGRNTAPAIALAALHTLQVSGEEDPILMVLAADHLIENKLEFEKSISNALPYAELGKLVTFGVVPTSAETGYGYIKKGEQESLGKYGFKVASFVEKPDLATAQMYVESGDYYWNSGMFMFKASEYLTELGKFQPEILNACKLALSNAQSDMDFVRVDKTYFSGCPSESIDYAVMEKTKHAIVTPIDAGWSDIGSWSALWDVSKKDINNNVCKGDIIALDSTSSYLQSECKLVAAVGVKDLIVVETRDAILVADKTQVQKVKMIVNDLKSNNRSEYKVHREVYRPWGKYDLVDLGKRDQVKRITVKPGEKLSIQMHTHRSEHWVVISGTAKVTNGEKTMLLTEDQSTYIPKGTVHALENPGAIPLEIVEVQTGSYLGEDDIVRFEDRNVLINK